MTTPTKREPERLIILRCRVTGHVYPEEVRSSYDDRLCCLRCGEQRPTRTNAAPPDGTEDE